MLKRTIIQGLKRLRGPLISVFEKKFQRFSKVVFRGSRKIKSFFLPLDENCFGRNALWQMILLRRNLSTAPPPTPPPPPRSSVSVDNLACHFKPCFQCPLLWYYRGQIWKQWYCYTLEQAKIINLNACHKRLSFFQGLQYNVGKEDKSCSSQRNYATE